MMDPDTLSVLGRVIAALLAGGLVGLERSFRDRAAGVRTYSLVSLGSALLVAVAQYWEPATVAGGGDPTRVIQGIVTGIGFLGAGVIVKEGFSVRGLTTAASIWVVSAIGVAFGVGFYVHGAAATVLTLGALSLLRHIENRLPVQYLLHGHLSFHRDRIRDEDWLHELLRSHGFTITELSYRLNGESEVFEYRFVMWSSDRQAARKLGSSLLAQPEVVDFRISPSRE